MFDKDGNGSISKNELQEVFGSHVDGKLIMEMIKEVDSDENGEIDKEEFKKLMLAGIKWYDFKNLCILI